MLRRITSVRRALQASISGIDMRSSARTRAAFGELQYEL